MFVCCESEARTTKHEKSHDEEVEDQIDVVSVGSFGSEESEDAMSQDISDRRKK